MLGRTTHSLSINFLTRSWCIKTVKYIYKMHFNMLKKLSLHCPQVWFKAFLPEAVWSLMHCISFLRKWDLSRNVPFLNLRPYSHEKRPTVQDRQNWGRTWDWPPTPGFGRSDNPISIRRADYAHNITTCPPTFLDLPTALTVCMPIQ